MPTSTSIYWDLVTRDTFITAEIAVSAVDNLDPAIKLVTRCPDLLHGPCKTPNVVDSAMSRLVSRDISLEYCVGTAALTTNVVIGDAIVWSRVCVLWPGSRAIRLVLVFLLLETFGASFVQVVSTAHSCEALHQSSFIGFVDPESGPGEIVGVGSIAGPADGTLYGSFFEGDAFGLATSILSLATNVISTCLIAYRAWKHYALIRGNCLRSFLGRSQVSRALILLIESAAFYSVIWVRPVRNGAEHTDLSSAFRAFITGWEAFTEGGLVVIIAIYFWRHLNRSECDTAVASHRVNDQDAVVSSLMFRASTPHSVKYVRASRSIAEDRASSFSDDVAHPYGRGDIRDA